MSNIRQLREQRVMTQKDLAFKSGLSWRTIYRIEKGEVTPFFKTVNKLAKGLGVKPETIQFKPGSLEMSKSEELNSKQEILERIEQIENQIKIITKGDRVSILQNALIFMEIINVLEKVTKDKNLTNRISDKVDLEIDYFINNYSSIVKNLNETGDNRIIFGYENFNSGKR